MENYPYVSGLFSPYGLTVAAQDAGFSFSGFRVALELSLVHGWDRIENLFLYSLLALSTHKNVKCYPTMTKCPGQRI